MKPLVWVVAGLTAKSLAFAGDMVAAKELEVRADEATALASGWRDLGCYSYVTTPLLKM
jgi:hypothetical protein